MASTFPLYKTLLVGLSARCMAKTLNALAMCYESFCVTAATDTDATRLEKFGEQYPDVSLYFSVAQFLKSGTRVDVAYVSLPHEAYASVIPLLLRAGIHVLADKPAATSPSELETYGELALLHGVKFGVAGNRRFSDRATLLQQWMDGLGSISLIELTSKIVVSDLCEGWRASKTPAGGGVAADLGWHAFDFLVRGFGNPSILSASLLKTRSEAYDAEDTALIKLVFNHRKTSARDVVCNVILSRAGHESLDLVTITGSLGVLSLRGGDIVLFDVNGKAVRREQDISPPMMLERMLRSFAAFITDTNQPESGSPWDLQHEIAVSSLISQIYSQQTEANDYIWPIISQDVESAVYRQLHTTLSIYDNSGIIGTFEDEFRSAHGMYNGQALLHNSGTNAIHALFVACGLKSGDEVIAPVYTFHATCSSVMQLGAHPVFCDALPDGTIDPRAIEAHITSRTKAVIVTHMWGMPCDMLSISEICSRHGIFLLEDCSHAHGAMLGEQPVGTFGDGAAWSLQGQKIVTGGEGGITLTRHADWQYAMLIHGHYNKRCKIEIPASHPLYAYSLTGTGLKNRAHPLAVSIAAVQLRQLPDFMDVKRAFADEMYRRLDAVPFLDVVTSTVDGARPAWYAFILLFNPAAAPSGLTRESFVAGLHSRGLAEVDIPRSTKLLHREPLFTAPWIVLPHLYEEATYASLTINEDFPVAQRFYDQAIKLPVWSFASDASVVEKYIVGIADYSDTILAK